MRLRPLLTPPRNGSALTDPLTCAVMCPNHGKVKVIEDPFDKFPALIRCSGRPFVVVGGQGIFVGPHLLARAKRPRLVTVLRCIYGDDALLGNHRLWVQNPGVKRMWQPVSSEARAELRDASAFGRAKAPPVAHMAREPEPVA